MLLQLAVSIKSTLAAISGDNLDSLKSILPLSSTAEKAKIENLISNLYWLVDLDSAQHYGDLALEHAKAQTQSDEYVRALVNLGVVENLRANYSKSLELHQMALGIAREQLDTVATIPILANIGLAYTNMNDLENGLYYYYEAKDLATAKGEEKYLPSIFVNLSSIFGEAGLYDVEERYLRRGLEYYISAKDTFRYPVIYYNLASLCLDLGKLDSAMSLFHEGLGYALAVRPIDVPDYYLSIAEVYVLMDSLTKAKELTKRAIEYLTINQLPYTESIYFLNLSQIHFRESRFDSAAHYARLALEHTDDPTEVEQSLETLYKAHQQLGNPTQAFEYLEQLNKELKRKEAKGINLKVARIYYERELSQTQRANFELGIENEEKTRDMVVLLWALLLLFFMLALISGLLVTNFRVTKAKKIALNSLEQSKNELERALVLNRKMQDVISHDLRTPLSGIISLLELSGDDGISKEELNVFMQQLQENTTVVLGMFDSLQKWAHHQNSDIELEQHEIDWYALVNKMKGVADIQAKKKFIQIEVQQNEDIVFNGDPVILEAIVRNLLSNAVKFSRENSSIQVISKKSPDKLVCSIVDQGVGMTPEMAERLKQGNGTSTKGTAGEKGTGLGFRIVNDFIQVHNGSLHIESTLGLGTTITFTINL